MLITSQRLFLRSNFDHVNFREYLKTVAKDVLSCIIISIIIGRPIRLPENRGKHVDVERDGGVGHNPDKQQIQLHSRLKLRSVALTIIVI